MPYTYLGRLAYITHDPERERPVHFQWQLIDDWPPPDETLTRMGLQLVAGATPAAAAAPTAVPSLVETPPPSPRDRTGTRTADFRARKDPDRSLRDAQNR